MSEKNTEDIFERELEEALARLQECQKSRGLLPDAENPAREGCYGCAELLQCATRSEYVKAAYGSMSKGLAGDFEF